MATAANAVKASSDLKNKLAKKVEETTSSQAKRPEQTIKELLDRMAPEFRRALPRHMDVDRLLRVAMTQIRLNPKLMECSAQSLIAALMQAAQLGLEPGVLGHCYLVPFRHKDTMEVTLIIGYRGMIDLARRSGHLSNIYARAVYQNDYFKMVYGLNEDLQHVRWDLREDQRFQEPGPMRGVYMVAKFKDGGEFFHYMSVYEIEQHRKRSRAANEGPWVTDYEEMAKKTVVRAAWKWLPVSVEIMRAVEAADESIKHELSPDMTEVPDAGPVIDTEPPAASNEAGADGEADQGGTGASGDAEAAFAELGQALAAAGVPQEPGLEFALLAYREETGQRVDHAAKLPADFVRRLAGAIRERGAQWVSAELDRLQAGQRKQGGLFGQQAGR